MNAVTHSNNLDSVHLTLCFKRVCCIHVLFLASVRAGDSALKAPLFRASKGTPGDANYVTKILGDKKGR